MTGCNRGTRWSTPMVMWSQLRCLATSLQLWCRNVMRPHYHHLWPSLLASKKQLMGKLERGHRWQPCHFGVLQPCGFTNNGNRDYSNCHCKLALSLDIVSYNCIAQSAVTEFPISIAIGKWGLPRNLFSCILQFLFSNCQFSLVGDPWQHPQKVIISRMPNLGSLQLFWACKILFYYISC